MIDTELVEEHPEIADTFAQLHPEPTDEIMLELNAEVDVEGRPPALVALDWLQAEGSSSVTLWRECRGRVR